jgi:iron(III) transport system substrate-binding protein
MFRRLLPLMSAAAIAVTPALADEVNVYSTRQPELVQPLFNRFTEETGIRVNVAFLNKGLTERLVAEGKRSPADLVMTVDIARLAEIVEAGVTQEVNSPVLEANIPAAFRDPGNHWFGLTSRARVVFAAKDRVDPSEVTTYEDLADPKWKGRICIRPGTHAYNLALVSALIAHHGEADAKIWLEGFRANLARKPQGNDRAQVKAVWAGECDIAIGNTYYMGEMLKDPEQTEWAHSVNVVFPVFEGGGTHVNLSGVAMTAAAPNRAAALKLMEFLASPEAQSIYADTNNEYPVLPEAKVSDLVASWGAFTPDTLNMMDVAAHRAAALRLVEEVQFDN